jgi:uncharacterized protein YqgV (UPF0045/DUF77 family)
VSRVLVEIQCLPSPAGTPDDPHAHVERAIAEIQHSGLTYEVGALGTTLEGEPDEVWPLLRRVHEACLATGARSAVSVIKVHQAAQLATTPGIDDLTRGFRGGASPSGPGPGESR